MLCQHCNNQEATVHVQFNINGESGSVHLCSGCAGKFQAQAGVFPQMAGAFWPMFSLGSLKGWSSTPDSMGQIPPSGQRELELDADLKHRRQLNELRARLDCAVEREDYEEAGRLRDEIKKSEKGVLSHES